MKVTREVGFMKPCVGQIFFVIDSRLIFWLSIYITILSYKKDYQSY